MRLILLVLAVLTLATPEVLAMSCNKKSFTEETSKKNIATADYIFSGSVINISPPPYLGENLPEYVFKSYPPQGNPNVAEITYQIDHLYKGKEGTHTIKIYDGWIGLVLKENTAEAKKFLKEYPDMMNKSRKKIFYAYNFGAKIPLNLTNEPFYTIPLFCFYVDEKDEKQIQNGTYKFLENSRKENMFEPDEPEENEEFENIETLKLWAQKNRQKPEIKTIYFKGEEIVSIYEYRLGSIKQYGPEDKESTIDGYNFDLYHRQKNGTYKHIGEYQEFSELPTTRGITLTLVGDILRITADNEGVKKYVDYSVSDLLGQSCQKDEHCLDGFYCLKNDYFKPRGLCSPCAEADLANRPTTCQ